MDNRVKIHNLTFRPLIDAQQIDEAVSRVAEKINTDYATTQQPPLVLGVLNGSFIFLSDLIRKFTFRCEVSFVKLASYEGCNSTGQIKELIGLSDSIEGRDIIIVEDIVDSGRSIAHMLNTLRGKGAGSIRVCTLLFKPAAYKESEVIDYPAIEVGNEFLVGYGLDYDQGGRELADIYVICD
ncbi:MAG: hypoxanthine phosphoribosyltransferase [Rikenellaceae bacterium]